MKIIKPLATFIFKEHTMARLSFSVLKIELIKRSGVNVNE